MTQSSNERDAEFYVSTYDSSVPDWPGEMAFYGGLAASATAAGGSVLEVACGTGRVAIRLAQAGARVVGLDLSPRMLAVARGKSAGLTKMRWVQADMRSFDLGETFALVLIPGHAFQNLNTSQDQADCLACIRRHLAPGGTLVVHLDHQDMGWLGDLTRDRGGVFEAAEEFKHPQTGRLVRAYQAWSYERSTQTAIKETRWEEVDEAGQVVDHWQTRPVRLHCLFRFEMEHLLVRCGFTVEAVYGDFFRRPLGEASTDMVWLAH
jgi:ubiquinone/menaquinone biosynthesis C-methylase UbiE